MSTSHAGALGGARYATSEDHLRLMAKVARMYHERGMTQSDIAKELRITQTRVSRTLKRAVDLGIVRTTVTLPAGVYTDLEEQLESQYSLAEAIVVDAGGAEGDVAPALGAAAAVYLETTLTGGDVVGISSWSATLLAAVDAMRPARTAVVDQVVQMIGGVGDPRVQMQATRLIGLFAGNTGATPVFMPAPGLLASASARASLMADPSVADVMNRWKALTMVLVGIGSLEPSPLLRQSGNALSDRDQDVLRGAGAVGDICMRFFDPKGGVVDADVHERVVGIDPEQLREVPRRIGVAGGLRKHSAVRAALLGGWVNVLVTDVEEARRLLDESHP